MRKSFVINENRQFRRLYNRGKSFVSSDLVTYVLKNKTGNLRYGITAGKKVGNAVQRNRCKRVIRAAFYSLEHDLKDGYDIVFVARTKTGFMKSTDIYKSMYQHLKSAGILL